MRYQLPLLAVKDVEVSKKFYKELFEQQVRVDYGTNVTFDGGFAIQQGFAELLGLPESAIRERSNAMELYFETDDLDAFEQKLKEYEGIEFVHGIKMHEWKQRVIRIYDPDYHVIEIGETMDVVIPRYVASGKTLEETAKELQFPLEYVKACVNAITLKPFTREEIPELTKIMKRAFDLDSQMFLNEDGGPDGYDTGEFLEKWGMNPHSTQLKILKGNRVIGATILWIHKESRENVLGCLFIDPEFENQGIGVQVWNLIEQRYPETKVWTTETPIFSRRNHNFYINKCGFHLVKILNPQDTNEGSFILEKRMER